MKKVAVTLMVFVMVLLISVIGVAKTQDELLDQIMNDRAGFNRIINQYLDDSITLSKVEEKATQYWTKSMDYFFWAVNGDMEQDFIYLTALHKAQMSLYDLGAEEGDPKLLEAGTAIGRKILNPLLEMYSE